MDLTIGGATMEDFNKLFLNSQQEMKRGTLVLAVLLLLEEPQYGYGLLQLLQNSSIDIEQNTLYPLLRRLEKQELLDSIWQVEENRPRRYYKISEKGKNLRIFLIEEWNKVSNSMTMLIKGGQNND